MTRLSAVIVLLCILAVSLVTAQAPVAPPSWAYPEVVPDNKPKPDPAAVRTVPDSTARYTVADLTNPFLAPDWHPQDHPPMPPIVAHGRKPDVLACGYCHRADGPGGPENAGIYGLPYDYIVQQLADYKSGKRSTAVPGRAPQDNMIRSAKAMTDEEIQAAARYFSSVKPRPNLRVVEANRVPKTYVTNWLLAFEPGSATEPLGRRIIDTPEELERHEDRDSHTQFVAYVPEGSIHRGEAIVKGQAPAKAPACASCHGKALTGQVGTPPIAGRYPSYIVRQLYEFQAGVRAGQGAALMKPAAVHLTVDDMIDVAAYLATLKP